MKQSGFTLIEALVALVLLTVGLIPAFLQATNAIKLSATVRHSLVASHIAQEGIEVVRAMRDTNWFATAPFDQGFDACTGGCRVQWDSTAPLLLSGNPPLRFDASTGLHQYTIGSDTPYSRRITITSVNDHTAKVVSEVTWKERGIDNQFALEEYLFDWLP